MSRGLGRVQRDALAYLRTLPQVRYRPPDPVGVPAWAVAEAVFHQRPTRRTTRRHARATDAQRNAVRRALLALEAQGLVVREARRPGQTSFWLANDTEETP
jgi:hypothetical protein